MIKTHSGELHGQELQVYAPHKTCAATIVNYLRAMVL